MVYYPHRDVWETVLARHHTFSSKLAVKFNLLADLQRAVNCVKHRIHPGALINLNWEPVNISLRQSFCDVLGQLEGSFSSVLLWHWEPAQSSDQGQHRVEQPLQSSREAGLGLRGMALEKHSSVCVEISFFSSVLSAGRQRWPQGSSFTSAPGSQSVYQ